jgi:uncharacterized protein YndB with AHSA1/START domain
MNEDGLGEIVLVDGRRGIRFERHLNAAAEKVWGMLTDPKELAGWLAEAKVEPRIGGVYALKFPTGEARCRVRGFGSARLLELDWSSPDAPGSTLRVELQPVDDACRLVLLHLLLERGSLPDLAANWHLKLDYLRDHTLGVETPKQPWSGLRAQYRDAADVFRRQAGTRPTL